ncbi:hypothetical protein AWW66_16310 [Micromonospora rosaria]|uniref:Uncharacterized protein n=1 Tax=Micromonospora rosaria TaxID=47874 RepID=A0A136PRX4_9ACTN|nr:hypothetical protein [Micromonospora rosaria]KXK60916.1 hypothetical protein AWW66_16310 [Micromonospora rosaria]
MLRKLGDPGLAWLAADRAMTVCRDADDDALTLAATGHLTRVLHTLGRHRHTVEVALTVAHRLTPPDPLTAPPTHLTGYGNLLLQAARGAAGRGDPVGVADLLDQADEVATLVGDDRHDHGTSFGPTLVALARVVTALDLDQHTTAVTRHRSALDSTAFHRLPPEPRAAHLLDVTHGCVRLNDLPEAGRALLLADRAAPAEVRSRPAARETIRTLLRRCGKPHPGIVRLAEALRIAV